MISNAAARSQEVGVRKVMGANRRSIIMQFWVETQIIVLISVMIGLVLTMVLIPLFNSIIGSDLHGTIFRGKILFPVYSSCVLSSVSLLVIILHWLYPRMKPVTILKSFRTFKINPNFSKVLVVLQYTASVVLMMSAFIINRQMHYISNKDLGFDKEQVLMISNPSLGQEIYQAYKGTAAEFRRNQAFISDFSGMSGNLEGANNTNGFILNGEQKWRKQISVDYDYFEMLGINSCRAVLSPD